MEGELRSSKPLGPAKKKRIDSFVYIFVSSFSVSGKLCWMGRKLTWRKVGQMGMKETGNSMGVGVRRRKPWKTSLVPLCHLSASQMNLPADCSDLTDCEVFQTHSSMDRCIESAPCSLPARSPSRPQISLPLYLF